MTYDDFRSDNLCDGCSKDSEERNYTFYVGDKIFCEECIEERLSQSDYIKYNQDVINLFSQISLWLFKNQGNPEPLWVDDFQKVKKVLHIS
jgi:hypothetical protein